MISNHSWRIMEIIRRIFQLFVCLFTIYQTSYGAKFSFRYAEYVLDEVSSNAVVIQRILENGESATGETIELTTGCPTECPALSKVDLATQGNSADYTFSNPAFTASSNTARVPIVINDDTIHEMREYFCLRVTDEAQRGSQWYTRITIPWNDYCTRMVAEGDNNYDSYYMFFSAKHPGFDASHHPRESYVGPWNTQETVHIDVFPDEAQDIGIFLTEGVDYTFEGSHTYNHYDILIDDSVAPFHTAAAPAPALAAPGSTLIMRNGPFGEPLEAFTADAGSYLTADAVTSFTLSYVQQTGTISLTPTTPPVVTSDTSGSTPLIIDNLFLNSAAGNAASFKVCGLGLDPKRIPIDNLAASGEHEFYNLRTIDDYDPTSYFGEGSCFVSDPDSNGNHWLQLDLGREFDVKSLVIFTIFDYSHGDFTSNTWLSNAHIYVGNCRSEDHGFKTSSILSRLNNLCNGDIGIVDQETQMIEVKCNSNAYGRYVYMIPSPDRNNPLTLCEVQVYGDEVPFVDDNGNPVESRVEFASSTQSVTEGDGMASLTLTRFGERETCTYVSYFTDISPGDADIASISYLETMEVMFTKDDDSITIPIDITQDGVCEDVEKYNVSLYSIEGGRLGNQCWNTLEITDDDSVVYALNLPTTTISENDATLEIHVDRSSNSNMPPGTATLVFTDHTDTNTAVSDDYGGAPQSMTFPISSGSQTSSATVAITDDECYEDPETFTVNLAANGETCSSLGSPNVAQITITDNDSLFKWDTNGDVITLREGDEPFVIGISRRGTLQDKTIDIVVWHISTDNSDITVTPNSVTFNAGFPTQSISINVNNDNEIEGGETFLLKMVDPLGSLCPNGNREDPHFLKVHVIDNDGMYYWKADTLSVTESQRQVSVCLLRKGDMDNPQTVGITSTGVLANSGLDFIPLTQISFEAGERERCVSIPILIDKEPEPTESFTLTITQGQSNVLVGSPNVATVAIIDSDSEVRWEAPSYTFVEGTTASVTIQKVGSNAVDVDITSSAVTAVSGLDFQPVSVRITIDANTYSHVFEVTLPDDTSSEPPKSFILTLSDVSSGSVSSPTTTINIIDNDGENSNVVLPLSNFNNDNGLPNDNNDNSGLGGGAIGGISSAAAIGLVAIIAAIGFVVYRFIGARAATTSADLAGNTSQQVSNTPQVGYINDGAYGFGNGSSIVNGLEDGYSFVYP